MSRIIEKMLNDISADKRIEDGMFSMENDVHMEVMREYLTQKGITSEEAIEFSNSVLEGKYPERQAYNKDGILVTFPTPQHKAQAIKRGTHFEENPAKAKSNLFGQPQSGGAPSPAPEPKKSDTPDSEKLTGDTPAAPSPSPKTPDQPTTKLPMSAAPANDPKDVQATTNVAPQATPEEKPEEPEEPTELPPPPIPTPKEKTANKDAIKKILTGDDYMLEALDRDKIIAFDRQSWLVKHQLMKTRIDEVQREVYGVPNAPLSTIKAAIDDLKRVIDSFKYER